MEAYNPPPGTMQRLADPVTSAGPSPVLRAAGAGRWLWPVGAVLLAVCAASPALRGDFLSGDDIHLVRDHVLVNQPSWRHAWMLLTTVHRDLYQPLPMLSFQADFAVSGWLGRPGDPVVFHLTNLLLHAGNSLVVFALLRRLTTDSDIAGLASVLFAVHPLHVEAVAWISGRMTLLSAAFALAGLWLFDAAVGFRRRRLMVAALLAILCAMLSKVRVELPVLLALIALWRARRDPEASRVGTPVGAWPAWPFGALFWVGWIVAAALTAGFGVFALVTTARSGLGDIPEGVWAGPTPARTLQSLGWYLLHWVWPARLSPWHPPQPIVGWGQPDVAIGLAVVLLAAAIALACWRYTRAGVVGLGWFLAGIAPTLPLFAPRAALAAERWAYLPDVGLAWISAALICGAVRRLGARPIASVPVLAGGHAARAAAGAVVLATAAGLLALLVVARTAAAWYTDDVTRIARVLACYPDRPRVHVEAAWAHIRRGDRRRATDPSGARADYTEAARLARAEAALPHGRQAPAAQALAWAQYRLGHLDDAIRTLEEARRRFPRDHLVAFRLGELYAARAGFGESASAGPAAGSQSTITRPPADPAAAESMYRAALAIRPDYLPAMLRLARLMERTGRSDEARTWLRRAAEINPFDPAVLGRLADLCADAGDLDEAERLYRRLLEHVPTHNAARVNLAVLLARQGRDADALQLLGEAIRREPRLAQARLNRAAILLRVGRTSEAIADYRAVLDHQPVNAAALDGLTDALIRSGKPQQALSAWREAARAAPDNADVLAGLAWVALLAGHDGEVADACARALRSAPNHRLARTVRAVLDLCTPRYAAALTQLETIFSRGSPPDRDLAARAAAALGALIERHADCAWAYYGLALALEGAGARDRAADAAEKFLALCDDAGWRARAAARFPQPPQDRTP